MRFFCEDVHKVWQRRSERSVGGSRHDVKDNSDTKQPAAFPSDDQVRTNILAKGNHQQETHGSGGVEDLDIGYSGLKNHVEKGLLLLAEGGAQICAVCTKRLGFTSATTLVCPKDNCQAVSHLTCLSRRFLNEEGEPGSVVPKAGSCPQCKSTLQWIDLVKEMSLRVHGESEVKRLMKKPRVRKTKIAIGAAALQADNFAMEEESEDEADYALAEDAVHTLHESEQPLAADWYHLVDDEHDVMSVTSVDSEQSNYLDALSPAKSKMPAEKLEVVIEDSDWSSAEILD